MTAAAAAGEAELLDVVTAVSAAEISLETVVAVRDEVVRAYQEILRMPI
jgi:flagellar hook-basal body complex protein FliE